jgi:hypothetical protein
VHYHFALNEIAALESKGANLTDGGYAMLSLTSLAFVLAVAGTPAEPRPDSVPQARPTVRQTIEGAGLELVPVPPEEGEPTAAENYLVGREMHEIVDLFMDLYQEGTEINGCKVVGLAHLASPDSWSVTLRDDEGSTFFLVAPAENGAQLTLREARKRK